MHDNIGSDDVRSLISEAAIQSATNQATIVQDLRGVADVLPEDAQQYAAMETLAGQFELLEHALAIAGKVQAALMDQRPRKSSKAAHRAQVAAAQAFSDVAEGFEQVRIAAELSAPPSDVLRNAGRYAFLAAYRVGYAQAMVSQCAARTVHGKVRHSTSAADRLAAEVASAASSPGSAASHAERLRPVLNKSTAYLDRLIRNARKAGRKPG